MPARAWTLVREEARAPARCGDAQARAHGKSLPPIGGLATSDGPEMLKHSVRVRVRRLISQAPA